MLYDFNVMWWVSVSGKKWALGNLPRTSLKDKWQWLVGLHCASASIIVEIM